MTTTVVLLSIFAASIGYATFAENSSGTAYAREIVYDAIWFEALLILLIINLIGSIFRYEIFNKKKFSVLLFHLAFIVMIIGAGITRYFGTEGIMHIREGETTNEISSETKSLGITASYADHTVTEHFEVEFSEESNNEFSEEIQVGNKKISIESELYMPSARETIVPDNQGSGALALYVMENQQQITDFILMQNETESFEDFVIDFDENPDNSNLNFYLKDDKLYLKSKQNLSQMGMMQNSDQQMIPAGEAFEVETRTVYKTGNLIFVLKSYLPKAKKTIGRQDDKTAQENGLKQTISQAIVFNINTDGKNEKVHLLFSDESNATANLQLNNIKLEINYGMLPVKIPFSIRLNDFIIERYQGSMSPSSFKSEITVIDPSKKMEIPYSIFMNNILKYKGYRFFQASYDEDERGTVLSVSDDFWGTTISYIGYLMLLTGVLLNFFNPNSRFRNLLKMSSELQKKKKNGMIKLLIIGLFFSSTAMADNPSTKSKNLSALKSMLVQDMVEGRIEPFNTFASDVIRKITKKTSYKQFEAVEVVSGMMAEPDFWQNEPIIKVSHKDLASELGASDQYVAFNQLFDFENGGIYKLEEQVNAAYHKEVNQRTKYDKEVINLDERINICYQIFEGKLPAIFPDPDKPDAPWLSPAQISSPQEMMMPPGHPAMMGEGMNPHAGMKGDAPVSENQDILGKMMKSENLVATPETLISDLLTALQAGNETDTKNRLQQIRDYQTIHGTNLPGEGQIKLEILYYDWNVFQTISYICLILGLIYLVLCMISIFRTSSSEKILQFARYPFYLTFAFFTAGLIVRWYISDHAPWSNGYETLVFVGWATLLSGLIFSGKSNFSLAITGILSGIALLVAGMSWMNPEITNLVPVLKSYWLIIHVAIITSSYGFLGMGALMGTMNLILMILRSRTSNKKALLKLNDSIMEISIIIELTLMIGLYMLTIGCFIGGVWANESWGRYWGWDPKETWALVSILVYSIILHLRNVPKLNNQVTLSSLAVVGFSAIIMTFFGVNYYLSGMHSYGQGSPPPFPQVFIWISAGIIILIYLAISAEKKRK
jgi:cytochrome c-type biogenesis protein CcsB